MDDFQPLEFYPRTGRRRRPALALVELLFLLFLFVAFVVTMSDHGRIHELEQKVSCLQHPDHAASSIGPVTITGGRARGVTTPTLVVCP